MQKEQQAEELNEMLNMIGSDHDGEGPQLEERAVQDDVDDMLEGRVRERKAGKKTKKKKAAHKNPKSDKGEKTF